MLYRLILKATKFQLPAPERLSTVVKNISGGHHGLPISNKVKQCKCCRGFILGINSQFYKYKESFDQFYFGQFLINGLSYYSYTMYSDCLAVYGLKEFIYNVV